MNQQIMYVPTAFAETDKTTLHTIIRDNPLATVITQVNDGVVANHIPLLFIEDEGKIGKLVGHVARMNPIWQTTNPEIEQLAIFHGKNAYITPNWYPTKKEHGKAVPTWNYEVVHVRGNIRFIQDAEWLHWQINQLTDEHEAHLSTLTGDTAWRVSDAPGDYIEKLTKAIVGLEMTITDITGKRKMSQNQPQKNMEGVKTGLDNISRIG